MRRGRSLPAVRLAALRREAEGRSKEKRGTHSPRTKADRGYVEHELQVHQVELEAQNEELRNARAELETVLRRSTELYDFSPAGYLTLKPDSTIVEANLTTASLLGIERTRLLKRRFALFVAVDSRSGFNALLARAFGSRAPETGEVRVAVKGKPLLMVQLRLCVSGDGLECGLVLMDISERHRALQESEDLFHGLFEAESDAVLMVDQKTGRILEANAAAMLMYGYGREAILALKATDVSAEPGATLQAISVRSSRVLVRLHRRKDGTMFPVEISGNHFCFRGRHAHVAVVRDITERRQAEGHSQILRDLALALSACSNLDLGLELCLDAALKTAMVEIGGFWLREESTGHLALKLDRGLVPNVVRTVEHFSSEFQRSGSIGTRKPVYLRCSEIGNAVSPVLETEPLRFLGLVPMLHERQVVGFLAVASHNAEDLAPQLRSGLETVAAAATQAIMRLRVEQALRASEERFFQAQKLEAIGQLAGGVAHDFNNVLATILMQLGLLRRKRELDDETLGTLKELQADAQRAAGITRQLLMFSRRSVMEVKPMVLDNIIANLLRMLRRLIGEHVSLRFEGNPGLPFIEADAGMVEQVLMNLVVNARDAMPEGGQIDITTSLSAVGRASVAQRPFGHSGRFICLAVADTGAGMDEKVQKRVFDPFFTTKEVGKGTGLGLATVHGIMAQHNGWVEVQSRLGGGALFERTFRQSQVTLLPDRNPKRPFCGEVKERFSSWRMR